MTKRSSSTARSLAQLRARQGWKPVKSAAIDGTVQLDGETARPAQSACLARAVRAGMTLGGPPKAPTVSARRASMVISTIGPRWTGASGGSPRAGEGAEEDQAAEGDRERASDRSSSRTSGISPRPGGGPGTAVGYSTCAHHPSACSGEPRLPPPSASPLAALGQDEPVQAFRDGEALTLLPRRDGARIELPAGRTLPVTLPERAEISALAAIDGGWVAAGSVPDASGRRRLFLLRGNDRASRPLAEPPGQEGRAAARPRAAWWTAAGSPASPGWKGTTTAPSPCAPPLWNGQRWQAPERVSFPGPGSQLALDRRRAGRRLLAARLERLRRPGRRDRLEPARRAAPGSR